MTASTDRFDGMPASPFARLRTLLADHEPGDTPINMALGEPQHPYPDFILREITAAAAGFGQYPPALGTPAFRAACAGWLERRYALAGAIDADAMILPANGTREALFNIAQVITPPGTSDKSSSRPSILLPNPFYQCYAAAALGAGAIPVYLNATAATGHLPDLASVSEKELKRAAALYICSPANPQGAAADTGYWTSLIKLARAHDIVIVADECYADIYTRTPPTGILEVAHHAGLGFNGIITFHSLSKRNNLPGLRSGFSAGDPDLTARFAKFRNLAAPQVPLPVMAASIAAWNNDDDAARNRALYAQKFDAAANILGNRFDFCVPDGGFFLWLNMAEAGGGEKATLALWREAGIRVLPGAYLSRDTEHGNPGTDYIRVALVGSQQDTVRALTRMSEIF
ncbi:aminotransferase class I/II-fold pyridoxal phosphate-dependent enzyme [Pyruvatibacter sp.]|uniref:aminotransferase class I/II-fold pyridoxal phosphate-dependent enzyme n=1 Tax=Pyruvatibacter sp. TaxID=1981328 RepID=UPI0032ED3772